MSRLLIIDAHAVLHRAYHSIPPLSHNGQPVNAIYGFYSMLLSSIIQLKPKYLVVCVDSPGPTFRSQQFIGYRAKRKAPDYDLISQMSLLPKTLEDTGISSYSMGGYEADDLIATITKLSLRKIGKKTGLHLVSKVTIITGDKDLMQLVDDKVELFVPIRGLSETKLYDSAAVREKLGVDPSQVIDLKALMGDMSDNYPGVAGVGPVVATHLLTRYHTLDNIYAHLDDIKPIVREKLLKDRDNAYLSQELATLIDNIPVSLSLASTRWSPARIAQLDQLFTNYNFKSLLSRLHRMYPQKSVRLAPPSNQTSLF